MAANLDGVSVRVHLMPDSVVTEMPLKRFFRYEIPNSLTFDVDG